MCLLYSFQVLLVLLFPPDQLQLQQPRVVARPSETRLRALLKDLADVERLLKDVDLLSGLARLLPKGACVRQTSAPPTNATWPLNGTSWGPNTTDLPREAGEDRAEAPGAEKAQGESENPHSQFSAFVQLWAGLQPILCGNNRWVRTRGLNVGNVRISNPADTKRSCDHTQGDLAAMSNFLGRSFTLLMGRNATVNQACVSHQLLFTCLDRSSTSAVEGISAQAPLSKATNARMLGLLADSSPSVFACAPVCCVSMHVNNGDLGCALPLQDH